MSVREPLLVTDWSDAIVAIARTGDRAQFSLLYAHFAPRLKAFLMRAGLPADAAEDLAQDAMVAVWRKAETFDPERASAGTWIFTIARNLRVDRFRRERRQENPAEEPALEALTPAEHVLARDRDQQVRRALASLPSEQREIIRQSYFEERAQTEIARDLGIPLGTVKSRVRLAVARLRTLMDDVR